MINLTFTEKELTHNVYALYPDATVEALTILTMEYIQEQLLNRVPTGYQVKEYLYREWSIIVILESILTTDN